MFKASYIWKPASFKMFVARMSSAIAGLPHANVRSHLDCRKSLVSGAAAAWVDGMHPAESHDLLQRLTLYATQEKYVYRHKWQLGDLAIWDNTGAMHRVLAFDLASRREYYRATLNGEEPITAVARDLALQA